jgi:hypothetical protein
MVLITRNKGGTKWGLQVKNNFLNISIKINIFFLTNINFPISILYICTLTLSINYFFSFCKANIVIFVSIKDFAICYFCHTCKT